MDQDYLLIGVDPENQFALRFLDLTNTATQKESLLQEFTVASVLAGSHQTDQNSTLFQLQISEQSRQMNAQISAKGPYRTSLKESAKTAESILDVTILREKKENTKHQLTTSSVNIENIFNTYLENFVEDPSLILLDTQKRNLGLWFRKLPDTPQKKWQEFIQNYQDRSRFLKAIQNTSDPDQIIRNLFDFPLRILAVTKPHVRENEGSL